MEEDANHESTKKAAKVGAKAVATGYLGSAGGKAVEALSNTKLGDKILDKGANVLEGMPGVSKLAKKADNMGALNGADVSAINNRAKNQPTHSANFGGNKNRGLSSEQDGLGQKDGLEEKDKKKEADNKKSRSSSDNKSNLNNLLTGKKSIKAKLLKLKIKLIIVGVLVGCFAFAVIAMSVYVSFDTIMNSIATFFGISEDGEEVDSLLRDEKYHRNQETGELYNTSEIVNKLKEKPACPTGFWHKIVDALTPGFSSYCEFIRYVKTTTEKLEKDFPGLKLDKSLILSSIFYGYATQPDYSQYLDRQSAPDKVAAVDHFESLVNMLNNGTLTKQDIDDTIHNSIISIYQKSKKWPAFDKTHQFDDSNYAHKGFIFYDIEELKYNTYRWEIKIEKNERTGKTIGTGQCIETGHSYYKYSLDRFEMFLRFGEETAHFYDLFLGRDRAYSESDVECNGTISKAQLLDIVASTGVDEARLNEPSIDKGFKYLRRGPIPNLYLFNQKAEIEGYTKDVFTPFTSSIGETVVFDYRNGYIYKRFPYFERAYNGEGGANTLKYDDAITPKIIEQVVDTIKGKKSAMNEILELEDVDNLYGYNNFGNIWSSVRGAYCAEYVGAPFNDIQVQLTDCDGIPIGTTNFKDYIMGVAYGEVSDKNDDYVKAQMVAAMSYALHRRGNYHSVPNITMKSGTCDQVYCSMSIGCSTRASALGLPSYIPGLDYTFYHGAAGAALAEKYSRLYDEASQFLLVKDGVPFNAHYVSTRQNSWYEMAQSGMSFTQIMQQSYADEGAELVRCESLDNNSAVANNSTTNNMGNGPSNVKKVGNIKTEKYNKVSPNMGRFYGYSYNDNPEGRNISINPEWIKANIVNVETNSSVWNKNYKVNKAASGNFALAYKNISDILENGVKILDGSICKYSPDDLQGGSTFEQRKTTSGEYSLSSYGIVQSWNYNKTYEINDKIYKPYSQLSTINDYNDFVSALGKEEDCRNINYILYKYAYEPAGFTWGRYDEVYDGSIFKLKY